MKQFFALFEVFCCHLSIVQLTVSLVITFSEAPEGLHSLSRTEKYDITAISVVLLLKVVRYECSLSCRGSGMDIVLGETSMVDLKPPTFSVVSHRFNVKFQRGIGLCFPPLELSGYTLYPLFGPSVGRRSRLDSQFPDYKFN